MYPSADTHIYDLGPVDQVLEGAFRPGHFNGVASVVKRLLELVQPTKAYFGKKDYQQYLVVKTLNERYELGAEIIGCEIVRESNGLAMSSRNQLLTAEGKKIASSISAALEEVKSLAGTISIDKLENVGRKKLNNTPGLDLEYFSISDPEKLQPFVPGTPSNQPAIALVAARVEGVRLIDNMPIWD
jgi:pantoate--beta-alanine ligase